MVPPRLGIGDSGRPVLESGDWELGSSPVGRSPCRHGRLSTSRKIVRRRRAYRADAVCRRAESARSRPVCLPFSPTRAAMPDNAELLAAVQQTCNDILTWIGFGTLTGLLAKAI